MIRLLVDGGPFFEAFEAAVRGATRRISIETYILASDATGWRIARALGAAADRGVEVRLVYDGFGSMGLDPFLVEDLENHGVQTIAYRPPSLTRRIWPWSRRNHRKSLVVDGQLGIVGGMNLAADYDAPERGGAGWRDTSLEVRGRVVAHLEHSFRRVWMKSGGARFDLDGPPRAASMPEPRVRFSHNFLRKERAEIHRAYVRKIESAKRRIQITNAYFIPDRRLRAALRRAAGRGVRVEVICAGNTDVALARLASRSYYPALLKAGLQIYEWHERVLHAKTAVVDDDWATIGSSNLDYLSSFRNLEVNAEVEEPELVATLSEQFGRDRARSEPVDWGWWKRRSLGQRAFDFVYRQLSRGY